MAWSGSVEEKSVGTSLTTVDEIIVQQGAMYMWLEIKVGNDAGDNDLDQFELAYKAHADGNYVVMADTSTDYTTNIKWPLLMSTADLTALGKGESALLTLAVKGVYAVRLRAAGSGNTHVSVYWQVR